VKKKTNFKKTLPMKSCPTCEAKFDEEIIRFCTKCGTPLLTENQPSFTALPSQASIKIDHDAGEETVVVRRKPNAATVPLQQPKVELPEETVRQRIVVPTSTPEVAKPQIQQQANRAFQPSQQQSAKKSNTALTVLLTLFGTLIVIGGGFGVWYFLTGVNNTPNSNTNANSVANTMNQNTTNVNSNSTVDNYNFNINSNSNVNNISLPNINATTTANLKTPKPTPKPTLKPVNTNVNSNSISNINSNVAINRPTNSVNVKPSPTTTPTPKPTQTPANNSPKNVSVGNITGRALSLPKPAFPSNARQAGANGQVIVQITVDQEGNVLSAKAMSGHPLLRSPAENAARQARFAPKLAGDAAKALGTITYNFQIQ
jgi:TonB family protein